MDLRESVKPLEYLKTHAEEVLSRVRETHQPMVITHEGEPRLVIQDIDTYQETQDALALLKIAALGRRAVERGDFEPAAAVFERLQGRKSRNG